MQIDYNKIQWTNIITQTNNIDKNSVQRNIGNSSGLDSYENRKSKSGKVSVLLLPNGSITNIGIFIFGSNYTNMVYSYFKFSQLGKNK